MTRDAKATRERILSAADELILRQGFAATSLDQILEQAHVTKGAFFHHFENKASLGEALMERFVAADRQMLIDVLGRAEQLASDPIQQVLVVLGLFREMFAGLAQPHPGCLIAAYCYQAELMTPSARLASATQLISWRDHIAAKLTAASRDHPPRAEVDLNDVADMLNTVIEGGFVMSKTLDDATIVARQIDQLRTYLALLFGVAVPATAASAG